MRPWEVLESADVPDDDGMIYLAERGGEYGIFVNGRQLMTNRCHGSEVALADLACDRLASTDDARILVGGLGAGFTLAAALKRIGSGGQVTVAELMPAVVRWNREHLPLGRPAGHPLRDERTVVYVGDVADLVEAPPERWSAILLDVDNGSLALTRPTNGWLYTRQGLRKAWDGLVPGGVLGIWSCERDASLTRRLRKQGFQVEVIEYEEPGRPGPDGRSSHILSMAVRS